MSYASQAGRSRADPNNPVAQAVCDRCALWWPRNRLTFQFDWRGPSLANTRILACPPCLDVPQQQLRSIAIPADPVPIIQPRVEPFTYDEGDNDPVIGAPTGLDPNAVMPFDGATQTAYRVPLAVLSVTSIGSTTIAVTCSAVHGMATNDQVAVEGLSNPLAAGMFSVTVTSATAFTYETADTVPAGALLTGSTIMFTALVGLPYDTSQIPQV